MPEDKQFPDSTGIEFFGRVSASVSHEIKNILAIVNENAGLLEDFVSMVHEGVPLSLERLERLAGTVRKQVQRADGIVKNMNLFAHSADRPMDRVDLYEAVCFIADICARLIDMQSVTVRVIKPESPVAANTHPFYLHSMLWACIESIMAVLSDEKAIEINFKQFKKGAAVCFTFRTDPENERLKVLLAERAAAVADCLDAELVERLDSGEIQIRLPEANP